MPFQQNTQPENPDTNVNVTSARVQFPSDWRDNYTRTVSDDGTTRREQIKNERVLSPLEQTEENLETLFNLPLDNWLVMLQKSALLILIGATWARIGSLSFMSWYGLVPLFIYLVLVLIHSRKGLSQALHCGVITVLLALGCI